MAYLQECVPQIQIIKIIYINICPEMQFPSFGVLSMTLSCSHYCTVNVPYVLLPECRPQLNVPLPLKDDPKFLACCMLPEKLPQFHFGEFAHLPLKTNTQILNDPTSRNPVDLNQLNVKAMQLVHL
jgi:hypothetical protein